jgi:biotin carboxyl carrier protein
MVTQENDVYVVNGQYHYQPQASDICHVHRHHVQVVHNNLRYELELPDHEAQASVSNANAIYAPMPGKIIETKVKAGDAVKLGQTLVVMEAMKMETEIRAVTSGQIVSLFTREGDAVAVGDALLSFS